MSSKTHESTTEMSHKQQQQQPQQQQPQQQQPELEQQQQQQMPSQHERRPEVSQQQTSELQKQRQQPDIQQPQRQQPQEIINLARVNYHPESESSVNNLIAMLLNGCLACHAKMYHFKRDDIALNGFSDYHALLGKIQYDFARKLMDYQVMRGARVQFQSINAPEPFEGEKDWHTSDGSLECCLNKFQEYYEELLKVNKLAQNQQDPHLQNFIEDELLVYLNDFIYKIGKKLTRLRRAGPGLGEYSFDRDLREWISVHYPEIYKPNEDFSVIRRHSSSRSLARAVRRLTFKTAEDIVEAIEHHRD